MNFLSWRNLGMIMLLGAAVALQGLALPARAAAVNLLTNGELTGSGSAPTGWMQWGEANHDAETALRRGSSGNAWKFWYEGGIFQDVTGGFTVGAKVYFGGYLYQASSDAMRNGNKNGRVEVEFRTSSDVLISTVAAQPILNASAPKDLWVLAAMSATVPANTGKIRLVIKIDSASSGAGMFYADDAFLETGGSLTAGNYYRRVNADIKAPNGNQNFFIRGMNLSGWIYPEAYMLQIPGGTYSQITAAVKNIMGSQSDSFWSTYQANQLSIGDLANFKSKGFNTVRVPFHYRTVCPQDNLGVLDFQKLDQITDWCEAQGLGVILDMHASPGGQSSDSTSDPNFDPVSGQRVAGLWTSTAGAQNQLRTVEIWKNLARHFRDRTVIVGYELLNEPELPVGTANSALWTFYQNAISAIRTSDPFHLIMVEGDREVNGRYTYDLEGFDRWDDNLSLAFHYYWQPLAASYLQVFLDVRSAKNLPLVMTESGENSNPWSFDAVKFFENPGNNVGWCWWGWKKVDNIAVAESAPMTPDYRWTAEHFYDASFPDITRGRLGLNQMAENLKTVNCAHDANYYLTLFDSGSVFNTARPYKSIALPGVIHASNYDEGNQGTGSFDSDYQAETYPPAWNHGSSGRNDGVDITRADDSCDTNSNGYYLSWLAAGEWVRFSSVQVAQAGNYYLSYR
ncbi:MAG: cellulase family glycosylhydrolase, partial [Candidatus Firestonebacteria bacterium]|nr:cellulase family glycosylhydrolase [Candidatus Firestonebacteria bacterium]